MESSYAEAHNTTNIVVLKDSVYEYCCVVTSQHNNSLCCDNAVIGNTTVVLQAPVYIGRLALTGHRNHRNNTQL